MDARPPVTMASTRFLVFSALLWTGFGAFGAATVSPPGRHSLSYIYTAFSRKVSTPGIHDFMAMGLLDGRLIDYFDSDSQVKVPMQRWMEQRLDEDYWAKGTLSRKSKQQWFKVNLDILAKRMRDNNTANPVLQWMHGCQVETAHGHSRFVKGLDQYSYNGDDFLYFDDTNKLWVAGMAEATQTKTKWDDVAALNEYTQTYLEKECVNWLEKFLVYSQNDLKNAIPPEVFLLAKTSPQNPNNLVLTCMATGFYPRDITMNLRKNGRVLDSLDGVVKGDVQPNGDGTHQLRASVAILKSDGQAEYLCEVIYQMSSIHLNKTWDSKDLEAGDSTTWIALGVVVPLALCLILAAVVVWRRMRAAAAPEQQTFLPAVPETQKFLLADPFYACLVEADEKTALSAPDTPSGSERSLIPDSADKTSADSDYGSSDLAAEPGTQTPPDDKGGET